MSAPVTPTRGAQDDRRLRVLHTATTFSTSSGAAENLRLTLELLPRDIFQVFLASPPGHTMERRVADDVIRLPVQHLGRTIRPWQDIAALVELYHLCKKWRFHVVHSHNGKDGILARWAAFFAGVPIIIHTIHNVSFRASKHWLVNEAYALAERLTGPITQKLLAVSSQNVQDYLDRGIGHRNQYKVVYSGLDLTRYSVTSSQAELRARLGIPVLGPLVGWCGRLNYQKDPLTFIRAAGRMLKDLPDLRFVVCGDDPLGEELEVSVHALAQQLGITDRLHFLGFREDLPLVLSAVDVVMHSSRYEGMGRTVCEALLCGRAVAGTAVDGMREVIISGERGGILVPPAQPEALADAALTLLRDPRRAQAMASAGKAWVQKNLSAASMVQDIAIAYQEALAAQRAASSP